MWAKSYGGVPTEPKSARASTRAPGDTPDEAPDGATASPDAPDDTAPGLPTQDELPYSDGEPLESQRHVLGMQLLIASLEPWLQRRYQETREGGFVGGDMFLYFSPEQVKNRYFRGPDVLVVLGVEPGERKSWVAWQEGKGPDLVIELLSESTKKTDKEVKPRVYRDEVGVREYYWFDPFDPEDFAGFAFAESERVSPGSGRGSRREGAGEVLEPDPVARNLVPPNLVPDDDGRITSDVLGLRLGPWQGRHGGVDAVWLRWYTLDGELLLTEDAERADEATRRADEATRQVDEATRRADEATRQVDEATRRADEATRQVDEATRRADEATRRADEANRRADKLADKLRELGLDPGQLG